LTLNDLFNLVNHTDEVIFFEEENIQAFLQGDENKITEFSDILTTHINNKLALTTLLLDNYATVDDESMSLLEIQYKLEYIKMFVKIASSLGLTNRFMAVIQHSVALEKAFIETSTKIEIPEPPVEDENTSDSVE